MCQILVQAGCSQELVGRVIEEVLTAAGILVVGPKMSKRTVAPSILEGGVMPNLQLGHKISKTDSLTISSDGTTHKNVNYESRHLNMTQNTLLQLNIIANLLELILLQIIPVKHKQRGGSKKFRRYWKFIVRVH